MRKNPVKMDPMGSWIEIDGSEGEGGGQILRTSLCLSVISSTPIRIHNIRAGRKKPGLLRQHLTCVQAAARVGAAHVEGARLGASEITFEPSGIHGGHYRFAIGSAGSVNLVLQTVLPALLRADGTTELELEGGTHNPMAPSFDFLEHSFLPLLRRMGARIEATLDRPGYFPAGGGRFRVRIEPAPLAPLHLTDAGPRRGQRGRIAVAGLERSIAQRERSTLHRRLSWKPTDIEIDEQPGNWGPGNVMTLFLDHENVTATFVGYGQKGRPAERVAGDLVRRLRRYQKEDVPVEEYLADQLLLPIALAGGGSFRTTTPTSHTHTNMTVIERFLPGRFLHEEEPDGSHRITWNP